MYDGLESCASHKVPTSFVKAESGPVKEEEEYFEEDCDVKVKTESGPSTVKEEEEYFEEDCEKVFDIE